MIDCVNSIRSYGKKIYGNKTVIFDKKMQKKRELYNFIISNMENALMHENFKIHYQPKVNLRSGELAGFEALVRWVKDDGEIISPNDFIPIFETNEFISRLDYYIFSKVCMFIKDNFQMVIKNIENLREIGFIVSMDDFGSGLSSLNRLKDIDVDVLKLDKLFIEDTLDSERGVYIIENIIKMSENLNIETVAEGIETKNQAELLKNLGCNIAQGYYFSKPIPEENVINYFLEYERTCF